MSRANSSFDRSRPFVVRRTRPSDVCSSRPAASAHARVSSNGGSRKAMIGTPGVEAQAEDDRLGGRRRRFERRFHAPWRQGAARPGSRRAERPDVAVEPGGLPAPDRAVEGVRARTDGLDRSALPVGEVVAALVTGPGPVRQLVAAEAGPRPAGARRGGTSRRHGRRPGRIAPVRASAAPRRSSAGGRRSARSAPRRRGRRGSARRATGDPVRARARARGCRSRSPASGRGCRRAGRG